LPGWRSDFRNCPAAQTSSGPDLSFEFRSRRQVPSITADCRGRDRAARRSRTRRAGFPSSRTRVDGRLTLAVTRSSRDCPSTVVPAACPGHRGQHARRQAEPAASRGLQATPAQLHARGTRW
jgi:hypothetical protein